MENKNNTTSANAIATLTHDQLQTLRRACLQAIHNTYGSREERELMMDRADGDAYAALFRGAHDLILATIPDKTAEVYEVYFDRGAL